MADPATLKPRQPFWLDVVSSPPIEAVTFDLYGTLLDFDLARDETPLVARLLAEASSSASAPEVLRVWLRESLAERAREPFRTVAEALAFGAAAARAAFGLEAEPRAWVRALEDLWARRPVRPGARDALEGLRARGLGVGVVTNLDEGVLDRVLARTGLGRVLDACVTSETARCYKPHPRPFRFALDRMGVRPGAALHVGDSRLEDGLGAELAGMWFARFTAEGPSLAELVATHLGATTAPRAPARL